MTRRNYATPLRLPEGRAGLFALEHVPYAAGKVYQVAPPRAAILGGQQSRSVVMKRAGHFHQLYHERDGVWMSDLPVEQAQMDACCASLHGHVLVGGLGLGYAATRLAATSRVVHVTVVERSPEVVGLVLPHLDPGVLAKLTVVVADLFEFLRRDHGQPFRWDTALYDIWQSDGERTLFGTVIPLLQLSRNIVVRRPVCWNEDVMRGQLKLGLASHVRLMYAGASGAMVPARWTYSGSVWRDWSVGFVQWLAREPRPTLSEALAAIGPYVEQFGTGELPPELAHYAEPRDL